jgi:hypothetical protein
MKQLFKNQQKNIFVIIATCSILILASIACGTSTANTRCVSSSSAQLDSIRAGVKDIDPNNDVKTGWAVKSNDFDNVWFVSAKIYGTGMKNGSGPGVWAVSGDQNSPGMILSVDGYAKQFSSYPDAGKTDASITMSDDGANEAQSCANSE